MKWITWKKEVRMERWKTWGGERERDREKEGKRKKIMHTGTTWVCLG